MTDKLLLASLFLCFVGFCCSGSPSIAVPASVTIPSDEIEIFFIPTNTMYQKRCIDETQNLVYCVDAQVLATVKADTDNMEIEFIAVKQCPPHFQKPVLFFFQFCLIYITSKHRIHYDTTDFILDRACPLLCFLSSLYGPCPSIGQKMSADLTASNLSCYIIV